MSIPRPEDYSTAQMALHWLVVALVIVQFIFNDGASRALRIGAETGQIPPDEGGFIPHAVIGISIFIAMSARLWLRLTRGVPTAPRTEPDWMKVVSQANHWAFYVVILAMPPVGLAAILTLNPMLGRIHSWTSTLLLVLIGLHVAGALLHWARSDSHAHRRMLRGYRAHHRID
jgi:cytochrome b561